MAETYLDDLVANYDQVRQARGWDWEQMAANLEEGDPRLAALLRSQEQPADAAPVRRKAKAPAKKAAPKAPASTVEPTAPVEVAAPSLVKGE